MNHIRIEDKPELRGTLRSAFEFSFTTIMWALWIYLFLPLATLIAWWIGGYYIYHNLIVYNAIDQLVLVLQRMGWTIIILFTLLRGWGYYNYYVFGRKNRRQNAVPVSADQIGQHFGLSGNQVRELQNRKKIDWPLQYDEIPWVTSWGFHSTDPDRGH